MEPGDSKPVPRETQIKITNEAVPFENFSFANLQWNLNEDKHGTKIYIATQEILLDEKKYFLNFVKFDVRYHDDVLAPEELVINYSLSAPDDLETKLLSGKLLVYNKKRKADAFTEVYPRDQSDKLKKGVGRELFVKLIDYIEGVLPNELNKPVVHRIVYTRFSGMSTDKWLKIFEPILNSRKYNRILPDEFTWKREYLPNK